MKYTLKHKVAYLATSDYLQNFWLPDHFIKYCKTCKNYLSSWACPPFDFNPLDQINPYPYTCIIGTQVIFSKEFKESVKERNNAIDAGNQIMFDVRKQLDHHLLALEKTALSRAFYAGSCHLCINEGCTKTLLKPCRYPSAMRPSLEAFGFDIAKTTSELLQLELQWGKNGSLPDYYILVSGWMSQNKIEPSQLEFFTTKL